MVRGLLIGLAMGTSVQEITEMNAVETTVADWLEIIRGEYSESPGLHLTRKQVQRLWGLDPLTCDALLKKLLDVRFLRRTPNGAYARADFGQ